MIPASKVNPTPPSILKRITQSISARWRSYKIRNNDPLGATLAEAARLADNYTFYDDHGVEIHARDVGPADTASLFTDNSSRWERVKAGASEIKENVKTHAKRGAIAGAIGGGLTGLAIGVIGGLGAGAALGPGAFAAGLIGPGLIFSGIGALVGAVGGVLTGLCRSAYYLIKDPEAKMLIRLKRTINEFNHLQQAYKNNRGKHSEEDLKKKWIEIQSLRMGVNSHRLNKTKVNTRKLIDHIRSQKENSSTPDIKIIKKLLNEGADPFLLLKDTASEENSPTTAPLIAACDTGHFEAFKTMLKHAADRNLFPSLSAVQAMNHAMLFPRPFTKQHNQVVISLNKLQDDLETSSKNLNTLCSEQKVEGEPDHDRVKRLLASGADPLAYLEGNETNNNLPDNDSNISQSALGYACQHGYSDTFATLAAKNPLTENQILLLKNITEQERNRLAEGDGRAPKYERILEVLNNEINQINAPVNIAARLQQMTFQPQGTQEPTIYPDIDLDSPERLMKTLNFSESPALPPI